MTISVTPMLMFAANADEAISFYVSLFDNSGVLSMEYYDAEQLGAEGLVKKALFVLAGQHLMACDKTAEQEFSFTPAISLQLQCDNTKHLQSILAQLSDGGQILTPATDTAAPFAWLTDRFGVSWQLSVA